jgi:hypothetical protein
MHMNYWWEQKLANYFEKQVGAYALAILVGTAITPGEQGEWNWEGSHR